jgi:hypothetical protein
MVPSLDLEVSVRLPAPAVAYPLLLLRPRRSRPPGSIVGICRRPFTLRTGPALPSLPLVPRPPAGFWGTNRLTAHALAASSAFLADRRLSDRTAIAFWPDA